MINDLEQAIKAIEWIRLNPSFDNEEQAKQSLITPILRSLGWDESTPGEFVTQYVFSDPKGNTQKVDFALFRENDKSGKRKPVVFIEAKKLGLADTQDAEKQLFGYADGQNVSLHILTDGDVWNFYLAEEKEKGVTSFRRFYRAILSENTEKTKEYAEHFETYLGKEQVYARNAVRAAKHKLEKVLDQKEAKNSIPKVWQVMLNEPNSDLRDLLSQAVEDECGTRPDLDDLENFLADQIRPITSESRQGTKPKQGASSDVTISPTNSSGNTKIIGYILNGERNKSGSGQFTLNEILKVFHNRDSEFMQRFSKKTVGRKRRLVAQNREDLFDNPRYILDSMDLKNGWWIRVNLSTKRIRNSIEIACEVAGIKYGSELTLIEK